MLVAQGDLAGALAAYRRSLYITVYCSKLGMRAGIPADERRGYLRRGLEIEQSLKALGRLPPNQDWIGWFEKQLAVLDREG